MEYQESVRKEYIEELVKCLNDDRQLTFIGTAVQGPVNLPTIVYNMEQVYQIFGYEGTLIRAYENIQALLYGTPVTLIKTTGTHGVIRLAVNVVGGELMSDAFLLKTKHACDEHNKIRIELEPDKLHIIHPLTLGGGIFSFKLSDYGVIGELVQAINQADDCLLTARSMMDELTLIHEPFYSCNPTHLFVSGASSEVDVNKDFLYSCLAETYRFMEGEDYQLIVPVDAYFTDTHSEDLSYYGESVYGHQTYTNVEGLTTRRAGVTVSFYEQLLEFCQKQFDLGIFSHGILGIDPNLIQDEEQGVEVALKSYNDNLKSAWAAPNYYHVSVVYGNLFYNHLSQIDGAYLAYAAFLHTVGIESPLTNTPLSDSLKLATPLTRHNQHSLNQKGFVTLRESLLHQHQLVAAKATSLSPVQGELSYYHNMRMCQMTLFGLNFLLDTYIGENIEELMQHQRMKREIDWYLTHLMELGWLSEASCLVELTEDDAISVSLSLKTEYMVESITINHRIELVN